ncbi:MAG: NAD(P)H-dependent oxidoreductase [Gammaproteobacteria bacterium]|nr:NAD(P)H-dependent oxidoreductase [Gammaproteobacteria bacterium]
MRNYKILVLLAHPNLHTSTINKAMISAIESLDFVLIHNLYENYPDFYINVEEEKRLLKEADLVVFQSPFYWYSVTPLLKLWEDEVLEQGFAYGDGGNELEGKDFLLALSTGGKQEAYRREGYNYYTMTELLTPFAATASLCGMNYLEPFVIHGSYTQNGEQVQNHARQYQQSLQTYVEKGCWVLNEDRRDD